MKLSQDTPLFLAVVDSLTGRTLIMCKIKLSSYILISLYLN